MCGDYWYFHNATRVKCLNGGQFSDILVQKTTHVRHTWSSEDLLYTRSTATQNMMHNSHITFLMAKTGRKKKSCAVSNDQ